jgi:hypothetical protein
VTSSQERVTSALVFPTLSAWPAPDAQVLRTRAPRRFIQDVGVRWQLMSARGSWSETASMASGGWRQHSREFRADAINELAGLMGSVGEQITLAWAAEQDVQRWLRSRRDPYHRTMGTRALAELSMHFSLGAAHGFANAVLRVLLLDDRIRDVLVAAQGRNGPGYRPLSTDRRDWHTFSPNSQRPWTDLPRLVDSANSTPAVRLVRELELLRGAHRFAAMDARRGMDYHRQRPQSVPTSSPRTGLWTHEVQPGGVLRSMSIASAALDPERDEREVRKIAADGLTVVAGTLGRSQMLIGRSVASFGYRLDGCDWRQSGRE